MAAIAFYVLHGRHRQTSRDERFSRGNWQYWKQTLSALYIARSCLAFVKRLDRRSLYVFVALLWLMPDPRIGSLRSRQ